MLVFSKIVMLHVTTHGLIGVNDPSLRLRDFKDAYIIEKTTMYISTQKRSTMYITVCTHSTVAIAERIVIFTKPIRGHHTFSHVEWQG